MRVAWLTPGFPSSPQDVSYVFLAREAAALASSPEIELLVLSESPDPSRGLGAFDVAPIHHRRGLLHRAVDALTYARLARSYGRPALARPRRNAGEIGRAVAAIRQLQDFRPHVIHSHFAVPHGTCGVPVAHALGAASVVSLRGVDVATDPDLGYGFRLDPNFERRFSSLLPRVDWCLTATTTMSGLSVDAGSPPGRTTVLANQIEPFWAQPHQPHPKPARCATLMLSVGGLTNRKGFDRGIRALTLLPETVHYCIIGEGTARRHLLDLAQELNLVDRVHLLGNRPPADVARWMQTADVYWFLSRFEAFGNVVLEAFASGLPLVATTQGVAADLLAGDQACHLLVQADDPNELARATVDVLERTPGLRNLSAFAPEARTDRLIAIYHAAIKNRMTMDCRQEIILE